MILDPKKKATTLATPRYVPEKSEALKTTLQMQAVIERLRQPKILSMNSRAVVNNLEGRK